MKLVTQYFDLNEADKENQRLRQSGVMTVVLSKKLSRLGAKFSGHYKTSLWVVFDDQFKDARQLLENQNHVPKRVISKEEMEDIEHSSKKEFLIFEQNFIRNAAIIITGFLLIALLAYAAFGTANDA